MGNESVSWARPSFNLCEPIIRLARCVVQERTSTRHRWRTVAAWSQYRGERMGEWMKDEPEPSKAIQDQAMATLVGMLRFERWPRPSKKRS